MNSIQQEQPEDTNQDLGAGDAVARIRDTVKQSPNCFFCTRVSTGGSNGVRPMNVRQVDDRGNLWFLSASDSHKNQEIPRDGAVALMFQTSEHSGFLQLTGRASVSTDRRKIKELWEPILKTWFTGGKDDPRITVIKVEPTDGYYWDNKHGNTIAGIKMAIGAVIGKTLDDSIEGRVKP